MNRARIALLALLLSGTHAVARHGEGMTANIRDAAAIRSCTFAAWRHGRSERRIDTCRMLRAGDRSAQYIKVADSQAEFELTFWRIVRESKDPDDYKAYLDVFPNGRFAKQARETLARLLRDAPGAAAGGKRRIYVAPAETIEKIEQFYTVRVTANLRQAPSTKAPIVGRAERGQQLFVLGKVAGMNWYKVSIAAGAVAYIAGNLIEKTGADTPARFSAPKAATGATGPAPEARDRPSGVQPADTEGDARRTDAPPPPHSEKGSGAASARTGEQLHPGREAPGGKSPAEIRRYWNAKIDSVKESGPHGDCLLVVGDPFRDPPEYDLCEDRNEKIESLKRQLERELAGQK